MKTIRSGRPADNNWIIRGFSLWYTGLADATIGMFQKVVLQAICCLLCLRRWEECM